MRVILILLKGEIRRFLRNRTTLALVFLAPALLIYITGETFGLSRSTAPRPIPVAVVNDAPTPEAKGLVEKLHKMQALRVITADDSPLTEARAREQIRAGALRFALVLSATADHSGVKRRLLGNPRSAVEMETVQALLSQKSSVIPTETVSGAQARSPDATRNVAGWATFFLLLALLGVGSSLYREKRMVIYQRLLTAPVQPAQILASKFLFGVIVGFVQLSLLFLLGSVLFQNPLTTNVGNRLLFALAVASACAAFSLLLAAIAPSATIARALGLFLVFAMGLICAGNFLRLGSVSIVSWATSGFVQVLWSNTTTRDLLPALAVLFGFAVLAGGFTLWRLPRRWFLH